MADGWPQNGLMLAGSHVEAARTRLTTMVASFAEIKAQDLQGILEMIPVLLILLTPDYLVTFANRFFRERFGEANGRRCFEYLFSRGEPCAECEAFRVLETMTPHEWEWLGPDGRFYQIFDFPFNTADGPPLILETGIDITEHKQTIEALRVASAYNRSLIEASLDPLVTIGPNGAITDVNSATEAATGRSRRELIGTDFSEYFTDPDSARAGYRRAFQEGLVRDYRLTIQHRDGRVMPVLYNASVYRDGAGGVIGVFAAARDITDRQRAEVELEKHRARLEELIQARTSELEAANAHLQVEIAERRQIEAALQAKQAELTAANRELRAQTAELKTAYQELSQADRHKNEFLATLSHELRNPLATIQNSLRILDHARDGEQAERAKAVINRQFGHLARLVDDLLDLTRITQNRIKLKRERLDLNATVRMAMEDLRSVFEEQGILLEADLNPDPVIVNADGARLTQVIGNLLLNAAKFTSHGGKVGVSVRTSSARPWASIRVVDTGEGIPPEMLPRLFQPFAQAETTLARNRGGLGLGLALCKGLVELHGGEVSAYSAGAGQGAEFVVSLPLEASPADPYTRERIEDSRAEVPPRRKRRVLVIDDNVDLAESLRELLELDGHEVAVAYSGCDGLAKAREFRPEAVLCDIGLPGMDGYEFAGAIRADKDLAGMFLVALSGYALPDDLHRAMAAGFDRHLAKPPDFKALERMLAET